MTNITTRLLGNSNGLGFIGRAWRLQPARAKHLFDTRDQSAQQAGLAEAVATTTPDLTDRIRGDPFLAPTGIACNPKRDWHHGLELEDIGHVVNERLRLACMQEADRRSVTGRKDCRFREAVEACGRLAETAIGQVRGIPITGIVAPSFPSHAVLAGQNLVEPFDPCPFYATQLFHGPTLRRGFAEAHVVHLADHPQTGIRVERKARLVKQSVRPCTTRLTGGIEPHTGLADPNEEAAHAGRQGHRSVGDTCSWLEHQASKPTHRNVCAHAFPVDDDKRSVEYIEATFFDE